MIYVITMVSGDIYRVEATQSPKAAIDNGHTYHATDGRDGNPIVLNGNLIQAYATVLKVEEAF